MWSKEAFGEFPRLCGGLGVLDLYVLLLIRIADRKCGHVCLYWRTKVCVAGREPKVSARASLGLLAIAVLFNIVGLDIGKWLQNAGGISTYVPLVMLVGIGTYLAMHRGSATHFSWPRLWPEWPPDIDKLNFWSSIAFAFTGMELVCAMSEEIREPHKTFPRAIYASTGLIAVIYVLGTMALLWLLPAEQIDPAQRRLWRDQLWFGGAGDCLVRNARSFAGNGRQCRRRGRHCGWRCARAVCRRDRSLPACILWQIHPKWKTPYISILIQAVISAAILVLSQINATVIGAYQFLVSMSVILYFIPFLYMYAAAIKLAHRPNRADGQAVLVPGGMPGIWIAGSLAFLITAGSMVLAAIPPGGENKALFEAKLVGCTAAFIGTGLVLYWRGAIKKRAAGL